jgi:UDP-glucose:glycoprotein glucosyltransferase
MTAFKKLKVSPLEATELLINGASPLDEQEEFIFDTRDHLEDGAAVIWLNNLEKDKRYNKYSSSLMSVRNLLPRCLYFLTVI